MEHSLTKLKLSAFKSDKITSLCLDSIKLLGSFTMVLIMKKKGEYDIRGGDVFTDGHNGTDHEKKGEYDIRGGDVFTDGPV